MEHHVARALIVEFLRTTYGRQEDLVILDDHTRKTVSGWLFFYQTRAYVDTGDPLVGLAGHGPILVSARDGQAHPLGPDWEEKLRRLSQEGLPLP